ncbi:MAG: hypothetical protein WC841_05725 [Candidatus Shapirobacteria bacterium]
MIGLYIITCAKKTDFFSQPSSIIFEKLQDSLFPKFLVGRVFAYMPSDGSNVDASAKFVLLTNLFLAKKL